MNYLLKKKKLETPRRIWENVFSLILYVYFNLVSFIFALTELACQPIFEKNLIQFKLSLRDVFQCGLTKVTNQGTVSAQNVFA